jgi:pimeloyl-ACP methyl ester carboxylesterase
MKTIKNKGRGIRINILTHRALMVLFFFVVLTGAVTPLISHTLLAGFTSNMFTISGLFFAFLIFTEILGRAAPFFSEKTRKSLNVTYSLILDWLISFVCLFIFLVDLTRFNPKKADPNQTPILLIHGYLHNSSGWSYFRYRLLNEGFHNVFTINLGLPIWSIEHYAKLVDEKVKEISQATGRNDLILIGHSMGGIIASFWATQQTQGIQVKSVISLSSPFQGTKRAEVGIGECAKQLKIGSEFLQNLYQKIQQSQAIRFFHIGSESDTTIRPLFSAFVSGKPGKIYEKLGHMMYLFSDDVIDDVAEYLQAA